MRKYGLIGAFAAVAMLGAGAVNAAGLFTNGVPQAGGVQYQTTLPLTGNELLPADTQLPGGLNPQSESISTGQLSGLAFGSSGSGGLRNLLIGGDFGTNPWQRGTSFAAIANTATYTADRFFALGGASSSIAVSKQTGAADITNGFLGSLRFQRTAANADVAAVALGQVLSTVDSARLQGQIVELSFWAKAGANFSAANNVLTAKIGTGTGTDQSATLFVGGTWTGAATSASQATTVSTTWTRYSAVGLIPVAATQVGVSFSFVPVGTAGTNDWVELTGVQLDVNPNAIAYNGLTTGLGSMASYEFRPQEVDALGAFRFFWALAETNGGFVAPGMVSATNVERAVLDFPIAMRAVPTCSFVSGGFNFNIAGTNTAAGTLTQVTGTTTQILTIGGTATGTAGGTAFLNGTNTTGSIACSAEL